MSCYLSRHYCVTQGCDKGIVDGQDFIYIPFTTQSDIQTQEIHEQHRALQIHLETTVRDNNQDFNIKWTIIRRARPYNNISERCDLCLTEKLMIITANPDRILNKRSELISKCRHKNKFYLRNN